MKQGKTTVLVIVMVLINFVSIAQNVAINATGAVPNASAMLDISATNRGLLIPRVALSQTSVATPITAPATSLLVYNTASINDVSPGYYYWNGSQWVRFFTGGQSDDWTLIGNAGTNPSTNFLGTTDAQDMVIRTNNTEKMRVESGGNVGIGTTSPAAKLHVDQTLSTANAALIETMASSTTYYGLNVITSGTTSRLYVRADGNVGVGTTAPTQTLDVNGNTRLREHVYDSHNSMGNNGDVLSRDASGVVWVSPSCEDDAESFESSFGIWTNVSGDDDDWDRHTGGTPSSSTGPSSANDGSYYIYCETSSPRTAGDVFNLQCDIKTCENPSISFDYHMYFNTATDGTLTLEVSTDNGATWTNLWSMTGNQGNVWNNDQTVSLAAYANIFISLRFSFTIGSSTSAYWYDCALDDIVLSDINGVYPVNSSSSGDDWALLGNAGTNPSTNFIGTTDNQELAIRTNNTEKIRITTKGQIEPMNTGNSVFIGIQAGENDDLTTNYNIALGYQAMYDNTTGYNNIAIGDNALPNNTSGYQNIAIGDETDISNTSGSYNISVGFWAGRAGSTVNDNVAVGRYALYQNQGGYNTGVGYAAGAGVSGPTYTYCTYLGYDADFSAPGTYTNAMALGNGATVTASNRVRVGNTSITRIGGQVGWTTLSDGRIKKNLNDDVVGIDFIMKLRPVTYNLDKENQDEILNYPDTFDRAEKYDIEKIKFSGFIAQEVEQAALEVGYDFSGVKKPTHQNDLYGLTYSEFVVPLVKATQEQQEDIEALKKENEVLRKEIEELRQMIMQK